MYADITAVKNSLPETDREFSLYLRKLLLLFIRRNPALRSR